MSRHSHWATVKGKKEIADKKRGQSFSKILRMISVAAKEGGDPETNSKLLLAMERAKEFNMPKETIERAIKRGAGELKGQMLEEFVYEAYGPGKIAILIEGITDNKNRAINEIKKILEANNGKLVASGSVKWMFGRKGCITIDSELQNEDLRDKEKLELKAIEAGAEDIDWRNNLLNIYTKSEDLEKVKNNLENQGMKIESASLDWVAKEGKEVDEEDKIACQKLFEALDESDEVQEIYSNLKV
jgi:YebC/PmpR family DNA-binding regulatory protein